MLMFKHEFSTLVWSVGTHWLVSLGCFVSTFAVF